MDALRSVGLRMDADGVPCATSICSPVANKIRAAVTVPRPNVIPVIFVPGIMGSNLMANKDIKHRGRMLAKQGSQVWRVDSNVDVVSAWFGDSAAKRQLMLNKDAVQVDSGGAIKLHDEDRQAIYRSVTDGGRRVNGAAKEILTAQIDAIKDRRRRGWGTVSWGSYGDFLGWCERTLASPKIDGRGFDAPLSQIFKQIIDDPAPGAMGKPERLQAEGVRRLMKFQFPVHAYGYNWLQSNLDSGKELADYIQKTIDEYNDSARTPRTVCEQVLVMTHSMGGLVARAAALTHGAESNILAVIHGVMPTDGAAAFYKRFVGGFMGEGEGFFGRTAANIAAQALGNTAKETTPVLGLGPGPMELAPNHLYNGGKPWLMIKDKQGKLLKALPEKGDPYSEIYRTKAWWQAVNPAWLNPAGLATADTNRNHLDALEDAEYYHRKLGSRFHKHTYAYYGVDPEHRSWGTVTWSVVVAQHYDPQWYDAMPGQPSTMKRQWTERRNAAVKGDPAGWRSSDGDLAANEGIPERYVYDAAGQPLRCRLEPPVDPGDGTVPGLQSAAGVDPSCRVAWRINGYEHQDSYQNSTARRAVLDAVIRAVAEAEVPA